MPLALRGLLYLKVEAGMKKYKLIIDYEEKKTEEIDTLQNTEMDRVWLDTGDEVVELPDEILPYLEEADILGIA